MPTQLVSTRANDYLDSVKHSVVQIGTVSTEIIIPSDNRRYLMVINDSNTDIYLASGVPAQTNFGILLPKNGGRLEASIMMGNLCCHSLYAIHGGIGLKRLLITEGF